VWLGYQRKRMSLLSSWLCWLSCRFFIVHDALYLSSLAWTCDSPWVTAFANEGQDAFSTNYLSNCKNICKPCHLRFLSFNNSTIHSGEGTPLLRWVSGSTIFPLSTQSLTPALSGPYILGSETPSSHYSKQNKMKLFT
jgi:hypothetical protein